MTQFIKITKCDNEFINNFGFERLGGIKLINNSNFLKTKLGFPCEAIGRSVQVGLSFLQLMAKVW